MQVEKFLPMGTVSLLCTDIEGSTRLLHTLGERYAEALAEHRRLLRAAFREHRGCEVDTQGDAFFYAFPRAHDAVAGAVAAQRALASQGGRCPSGEQARKSVGVIPGAFIGKLTDPLPIVLPQF